MNQNALLALAVCGLGGLAGYALVKGKLTEEKAEGEPMPTKEQELETLINVKPRLTETIHIDTTQARDKTPYSIAGQSIFVLNPATPSLPVYIRLNEPESDQIELTEQRTIKAPFYRFYITNAVGTGTLTVIINKVSAVELNAANINANIVAQTIENLLMTFNAQTVGVYLQPEWATTQNQDKNLRYIAYNKAPETFVEGGYTVPPGKTLYIVSIETFIYSYAAADGDKPQHFYAGVFNEAGTFDISLGGSGGTVMNLTRPLRANAGDQVGFSMNNMSNHNCNMGICAQGYEI